MKRKLFLSLFAGLLLVGVAFFTTSCEDDVIETAWNIENFTIQASQWSWNPEYRRWEAVVQLQYIDEFIYESGAVIGYLFLGDPNIDEVQVQLPYDMSYRLDNGTELTDVIGYEYSVVTNRVTFYIKPKNGLQNAAAKFNYDFRIVMIW